MPIDISIVLNSFGLYSSTSDSTSDSLHPFAPCGGLRSLGVILKIYKRSELRKDRNPHVATIKFSNISESWKKLVSDQFSRKFSCADQIEIWKKFAFMDRLKLENPEETLKESEKRQAQPTGI